MKTNFATLGQMIMLILDVEDGWERWDGEHKGRFLGDTIALQMQDVSDIEGVGNGLVMDTGSILIHVKELQEDTASHPNVGLQ